MLIALPIHILAAVVWIGGMFFVHNIMRPGVATLEAPVRLALMRDALTRFFRWVWICIALLWLSGIWIITSQSLWSALPWHVLVMMLVAVLMTVLFCLIYFDHFRKITGWIDAGDFKAAGERMGRMSKLVSANLGMGIFVVLIAGTRGAGLFS